MKTGTNIDRGKHVLARFVNYELFSRKKIKNTYWIRFSYDLQPRPIIANYHKKIGWSVAC